MIASALSSADTLLVDTFDEFTDERELYVFTISDTGDQYGFMCSANPHLEGKVSVMFKPTGFLFHLERTVKVKLRFDDSPYEEQTFLWGADAAIKLDGSRLLKQAIAHETLIAKVGDSDTMRFDLSSGRSDLVEFEKRCADW